MRVLLVDPLGRFLWRPIGPFFFPLGKQKAALWLQNSQYIGLSGEHGNLKTQARVKFSAVRMEVPMWSDCFKIPRT